MSDDHELELDEAINKQETEIPEHLATSESMMDVVKANPVPQEMDLMTLGRVMVASGFFKNATAASQAIVKILAGRELGIGPIASMVGVYIVDGKVSIGANLMAAALKRSGKYNYKVREHVNTACTIEFFERGESVGISQFTIKDAEAAGVAHKPVWKQYPRNLMFARALSNGVRWYAPDIMAGPVYSFEEVGHEELETYDE